MFCTHIRVGRWKVAYFQTSRHNHAFGENLYRFHQIVIAKKSQISLIMKLGCTKNWLGKGGLGGTRLILLWMFRYENLATFMSKHPFISRACGKETIIWLISETYGACTWWKWWGGWSKAGGPRMAAVGRWLHLHSVWTLGNRRSFGKNCVLCFYLPEFSYMIGIFSVDNLS